MAHKGKSYRAAAEKIDREKLYSLKDAVSLIRETKDAKFDETVELAGFVLESTRAKLTKT